MEWDVDWFFNGILMGFNGHMLLGCLGCYGHMFFFMGFYVFFQWGLMEI